MFLLAIISLGAVSATENNTNEVSTVEPTSDTNIVSEEISESSTTEKAIKTTESDTPEKTLKSTSNKEEVLRGEYPLNKFDVYVNEENANEVDVEYGDDIHFKVVTEAEATNSVNVVFNGKNHIMHLKNVMDPERQVVEQREGYLTIVGETYPMGTYNVVITYPGDSSYASKSITKTVVIVPRIDYEEEQSVGEQSKIIITAPGHNGNAKLYRELYDSSKGQHYYIELGATSIVNGVGAISTSAFSAGPHNLVLNYTVGGISRSKTLTINVEANTAGVVASVTPTITFGNNAIVTFSGVKSNDGFVNIYVDDKLIKTVKVLHGTTMSEPISGLTLGTHKVKVSYNDNGVFYSNTFQVTVNAPVTPKITSLVLKKVTVKRSAKQLVLQATLKINKKATKNKKLTFTFKGKKYTAKTNTKGIAKVTIKKAVLKKLKAGKKITYQVTYGKTVRKRTVIVKK